MPNIPKLSAQLRMLAEYSRDPDAIAESPRSADYHEGVTYAYLQAAAMLGNHSLGVVLHTAGLTITRRDPATWLVEHRKPCGVLETIGELSYRWGETVESLAQRAADIYWQEQTEVTGVVA